MTHHTLTNQDLRRVVGTLPKDVLPVLKDGPLFLAGGYIRARVAGEDVSDIDLLADTSASAEAWATMLASKRGDKKPWRTKNAFTLTDSGRTPVQFIHRWTFADPVALIESFDFTVAQAVVWHDAFGWHSLVAPSFYQDLAARRLRYTFPQRHEDAGGSILRVQKFLKRGYDIAPEELAKVIARLIGGVRPESGFWSEGEAAQGKILAGLLRQVDPLTVIDGIPADDCLDEPPAPEVFPDEVPA